MVYFIIKYFIVSILYSISCVYYQFSFSFSWVTFKLGILMLWMIANFLVIMFRCFVLDTTFFLVKGVRGVVGLCKKKVISVHHMTMQGIRNQT